MNILFATARFPYPPTRGDKAVVLRRLQGLSRRHQIHLVTYAGRKVPEEYMAAITNLVATITLVRLRPIRAAIRALVGLLQTRLPLQVLFFSSPELRKAIEVVCTKHDIDLVDAFPIRIAQSIRSCALPKVLDLIDSMVANFSRRVATEPNALKRALLKFELRRLREYEPSVVREFDAGVLVAASEVETFDADGVRLEVIPLGVQVHEDYRKAFGEKDNVVAISGRFAYYPNAEATVWFVERCLDRVLSQVPDAQFWILGADPPKRILKLAESPYVRLTGFVEDLARELSCSKVAVAPMQSGSGMQNKVLEAMAVGVPVVSTTLGMGSIEATDGESILVADDSRSFADYCVRLLLDAEYSQAIADSGYNLVREHYSVEHHCSRTERLYLDIIERARE